MIRVLVVEDEKIVRKGIISVMPWEKYGMTVAGEAANGRSALEFLHGTEVDLLVTDLSMPGLSGIPYLTLVKEEFPDLPVVILTFHQEFSMIQDALRLGVIDYITKSQIEEQNTEEILRRISNILKKQIGEGGEKRAVPQHFQCDTAVVAYCGDGLDYRSLHRLQEASGTGISRLDEKIGLFPGLDEAAFEKLPKQNMGIQLIFVSGIGNLTNQSMLTLIYDYIRMKLFYEFLPQNDRYRLNLLEYVREETNREGADRVREQLSKLKWLEDEEACMSLIRQFRVSGLDFEGVRSMMYLAYIQWSYFTALDIQNYFTETQLFNWWYEWEQWLRGYREILKKSVRISYQNDIDQAIRFVIEYINKNYAEPLTIEDLLEKIHISKSYFSQLFKKATGTTFSDYLRDVRINRAKQLLRETELPVPWISEQVGYSDERYFRKVFRAVAGCSPNEYRQ